jgi:acyl-ACP thioesterase
LQQDLVGRPERGRIVTIDRHVGLSDVRPDTTARLDAIARFLQDAADGDAASSGFEGRGVWVLRRLAMHIDHTPRFRAYLTCSTWCSGVGARWAERRTDVRTGDVHSVGSVGIWVHVDRQSGAPVALPDGFDEVWGVSANGRRVRPNLRHPAPPAGARFVPWPLRATDFDVLDHVNNAAYWAPVEEEVARRGFPRVVAAEIEFRGAVLRDDPVEVATVDTTEGFATWCRVGGDVRASTLVACAS